MLTPGFHKLEGARAHTRIPHHTKEIACTEPMQTFFFFWSLFPKECNNHLYGVSIVEHCESSTEVVVPAVCGSIEMLHFRKKPT